MKLLQFVSGNISDKKPIFASHADRMLYCGIVCKTHSLIGWQCSHDDDDHDDFSDDQDDYNDDDDDDDYSDDHDDDYHYDDVHHNDEIENTCPFFRCYPM